MISVAHRASVAKFHRRRLTLHPETRSIEESSVPATPAETVILAGGNGRGGVGSAVSGGSRGPDAGKVLAGA